MNRAEVISMFRTENPEITTRVISNALLGDWCKVGDKEICAITRCIVGKHTITTSENDSYWDLTNEITNFYSIDEYPGGGVAYNGKRLKETSIAQLDRDTPSWRSNDAGTPKKYYRRGKYLYLDRPIDSEADDIDIYSVLISDDFDSDEKLPFNQLTYLEPFHTAMIFYLQKRAKMKIGKTGEEGKALREYNDYVMWMKKEIKGEVYSAIYLEPKK